MAHSNTVISQVLRILPRHEFKKLAETMDSKRRRGSFTRWSQFVALSTAQLTQRASLRDIEMTMQSQKHNQYHLGCQNIKRSTLARANEHLDADFYQALFLKLYERCQHASPKRSFRLKRKLFSLDASIISVSMKLFPKADYNTMKAAFKLHVGLDHDGMIPAFAAVTEGKESDMSQARLANFPKGSILVFDRGYNDQRWHNSLIEKGIFYVTRERARVRYRVIHRQECNEKDAITSDQVIEYTGKQAVQEGYKAVRRVGYRDPETGKHYVFHSNNFQWSAKTIADVYKQRWQVELFFKWIKQNLKIKTFLGNSENAVKTQIFAALCVYLLLAFIKFSSRVGHSYQQILRLIRVNAFSKISLMEILSPPEPPDSNRRQLELITI